jgi:hypothetical protein
MKENFFIIIPNDKDDKWFTAKVLYFFLINVNKPIALTSSLVRYKTYLLFVFFLF